MLATLLIEIVKNRKIIESGKKNTIDHQFAMDDFSMQIVNLKFNMIQYEFESILNDSHDHALMTDVFLSMIYVTIFFLCFYTVAFRG